MAPDRSLEAPALDLGRALRARGHDDLAALLLEVVPETGSVRGGPHRALVAERLRRVVAADHVAHDLRARADYLLGLATADARARHGRTGAAWIVWSGERDDEDIDEDEVGDDDEPAYWVSWQSEGSDDPWCEAGPAFTDLRDALAWARERTDAVIVRPAWDEGTYYWAGRGPGPRDLPGLDESRD